MNAGNKQMASGHGGNRSVSDLEAELSRCQMELQILRSSTDESGARDRNLTELLDKVQVLEKQKVELLVLIKKQMRLIDVLKKQKVHLESSNLIHFQEDELIKYINFGAPTADTTE
ncbi:testis-expressed protein 9-like isoform X4 [Varroa jacobsoni]|uniref:testis-expressed protein 9-like isoform X4 n=1 Tax=Varroa jacobsoni TaxID=62625 RepID=UPI000BF93B77|nr:testis-expressed protein 9-like isoform X4 [Varroa jacobsoni]